MTLVADRPVIAWVRLLSAGASIGAAIAVVAAGLFGYELSFAETMAGSAGGLLLSALVAKPI